MKVSFGWYTTREATNGMKEKVLVLSVSSNEEVDYDDEWCHLTKAQAKKLSERLLKFAKK